MAEFRRDPTTHEWVIVAPERGERPGLDRASRSGPAADHDPACPFCLGNESRTPAEVARRPAQGPWAVRVVPNKFPALVPDVAATGPPDDFYVRAPARGYHEVAIEGPQHGAGLVPRRWETLRDLMSAAGERLRAYRADGMSFACLYKNFGRGGGASLTHPHWQLVGSTVVPGRIRRMAAIAEEARHRHDRSLFSRLVEAEERSGERVIESTPGFVVCAAYAPQWPGETWILPRGSVPEFPALAAEDLEPFAMLLHATLVRVAAVFGEPPCNVVVFSPPLGGGPTPHFTWHVRIQPRLSVRGGFESASGMAISTVAPEEAARRLRDGG